MRRVLILGGYGNFGGYIARILAQDPAIQLIISGRSQEKANDFVAGLDAINEALPAAIDIHKNLRPSLRQLKPDIVIHTSGPFQSQDYDVAKACMEAKAHYIDLADGRDFVSNIRSLDPLAKAKNRLLISGASSVPCLTSSLIDHYQDQFKTLKSVQYGITTAQKSNRGLATTVAILGYTGKIIPTIAQGKEKRVYGWQDLHSRDFKGLGKRYLGNCDIPDLSLFPERYPDIETLRFYAGLEMPLVHWALWGLSWLVRSRIIQRLDRLAKPLLKISCLFDPFGTENSGFFMELEGTNKSGNALNIQFDLTAKSGDGPFIPCMPAVLLTRKLASETLTDRGAYPCMG
ncbi:MAG: saccharopine dehydrogenase NADP-binding domain-containing protein, partial [Sneathiella sp.]